MSQTSNEPSVIQFIKKLIDDQSFADSIKNAKSVSERRQIIEKAGITINFTSVEVVQHLDRMRLTAMQSPGSGGAAGAQGVDTRVAGLVDAIATVVIA